MPTTQSFRSLTFTSQSGYNQDFLSSTEDYNRFDTSPGIFVGEPGGGPGTAKNNYYFQPDPAAGTGSIPSDAVHSATHNWVVAIALWRRISPTSTRGNSAKNSELASSFGGPFNFSVGGNYLHYETEENYYVFINALTDFAQAEDQDGNQSTLNNSDCLQSQPNGGFQLHNPITGGGEPLQSCDYVDTNPITSLNNKGHNYFLSQNPYTLNSYAAFGEAYYNLTSDLKLTGGLRWTEDQKHFIDIPSQVITQGYGYPITAIVNQQWDQFTGRAVVNWSPKLDFTDQTLIYGSYSRGYKAGGANPPGAILSSYGDAGVSEPIHPLTFKPEFVNAFELGSKNTLLDGALTLNDDVFYYDYKNYQISEIVDRTSINLNFDAKVKGAELEATWEPTPGLRFNFAGGYENTRIDNGQSAIDLMDRTAGMPGWMVIKPFPTEASNCILPTYVVQALLEEAQDKFAFTSQSCGYAYNSGVDPVTIHPYVADPTGDGGFPDGTPGCNERVGQTCLVPIPTGYIGFDPSTAPNRGEGFSKDLGGNELPGAPPFTVSWGAQYTIPLTPDWAGTLRGDYYWQDYSWARVFNDNPYDRIRGYTNLNLTLIFTNQDGWQVMLYDKNVFNETAITGDFLNSDDSGLTTNVFLTDPKLIGIRVTKNW